jgi:hypothetical protein
MLILSDVCPYLVILLIPYLMKRLFARTLLALLLALVPLALQAGFTLPEGRRSVRIPIEVRHNVVLIPVKINGTMELNFILDTGVRTTILTEPLLVNFLEFDTLNTVTVRGLGEGDAIEAQLARNVRLDLPNGITGKHINLLVLPEGLVSYSNMFGKPVYGIMGYELFGRFAVEINYQHEYITVWNPFAMRPFRSWERHPIRLQGGKPYVQATLTDQHGNTHEEEWLIDTGASMALSLFDDQLNVPDPSIDAFLGKGLSGNVYGKLSRLPRLTIGSFELEDIVTGFPDLSSLGIRANQIGWYGNIGAEVISRFRIVFDYPHRQVLLKKTMGFRRPFEYNRSGLELITLGTQYDTFVISYVRPDSPAAKVGLQVDDEIISLNGNSTNGLTIEDLYGSLSQHHGKTIVVKIKRGEQVLKKRFELHSEI